MTQEDLLTVAEVSDALDVSRQLIYYHVKKIPDEEKIYNRSNQLVFNHEQVELLKQFMENKFEDENELSNKETLDEKSFVTKKALEDKTALSPSIKTQTSLSKDKETKEETETAMTLTKEGVNELIYQVNQLNQEKLDIQKDQIRRLGQALKSKDIQLNIIHKELDEKNNQIQTTYRLLEEEQKVSQQALEKIDELEIALEEQTRLANRSWWKRLFGGK